jgi:hypothetical protein
MSTSVKTLIASNLPVGFTGSQGAIGYTGSFGTTGFTGSAGTTGFTGSFGTTGFTGSFGTTGFTGSFGTTGFTGSFGTTGFTGSFGTTGFSGSQGATGFTGSWGGTALANVAMANNNIINPVLTGYTEIEVSNTATTGAWSMNCAASNFFELTLTGSITISPTNVPPNTRMWSGTIVAKQDATGGRTITWPSGTKWPGGSVPPATTTANAIDIWSLMTYDGGTTWVASLSVKNVA